MEDSPEHPENVESSIEVTLLGMFMEVSASHP